MSLPNVSPVPAAAIDQGHFDISPRSEVVRARIARGPRLVLFVGVALTGLLIALMALDPAHASSWEILHWDVSAGAAVLAVIVGLHGTTGQVHRVRFGSAVALSLWFLGNLAWTVMTVTGTVAFPNVADVLALLWVVPGGWLLVSSTRGRLRAADEAALYLDNVMAFLATLAVLLTVFGPTAYFIGGAAGLLVALHPAVYLGGGVMSLVTVFALRQPLRLDGALATGIGTALIGIAFSAWVIPAVTGMPTDRAWGTLFSIGALIVAYGAITWRGSTVLPGHQERLVAAAGWSIGPIAVLVTAVSAALMGPSETLHELAFWLTVLAAALLVARFALHLRERTSTLDEVRSLFDENVRLVELLRREAMERERAHARLVDASRMSAVGELAAAVAHEVNNPLTGVLGYSDLLLADPDLKPEVREDLQIVRSEAMRVRDRVRLLLDFATPRRPDDIEADVGDVVAAPMALLRYHLERRGLVVDERYAPMARIVLDPAAIQQVLITIVTEITAAMPSGGRLVISTEDAGCGASIILDATGQGFDVDAIRSADSPFDDEPGGDAAQGAMAASIGVLRGHDATIGVRAVTTEHIRIEIHLPRRSSTPD